MLTQPEIREVLEPLKKLWRGQEYKLDRMMDRWELEGTPWEKCKEEYFRKMALDLLDQRAVWKRIEKEIGRRIDANTNND